MKLLLLLFAFTCLSLNVNALTDCADFPNKTQLAEIKASLSFNEDCVMAKYISVHVPSEDKTYYEALFWDTKTGKSKLYFYSYDSKTFKAYGENVQFPASPLGHQPEGKVMADYTAVHVPSQDKTYYEALFWDTKTGKSKLYFYSYTSKTFEAYEDNVQLPAQPLSSSVSGSVMADYTSVHVPSQDKTYYEVLFWDTDTGKSKLYAYNYESKTFTLQGDNVQFPASPLGSSPEGKVMADYSAVHIPSEDKTYYEALFWDTKTGKSILYYYNYSSKEFVAYGDNVQFPSKPLTNVTGDIMVNYTSVHVPSQDKTYYEALFWDTETGKSKLYFYNSSEKIFKAYAEDVQLPASPLDFSVSGNVMANYVSVHVPSQDKTYYEVLLWDTKTGESNFYFYSYDTKGFKAYGENVQFPASPLTD